MSITIPPYGIRGSRLKRELENNPGIVSVTYPDGSTAIGAGGSGSSSSFGIVEIWDRMLEGRDMDKRTNVTAPDASKDFHIGVYVPPFSEAPIRPSYKERREQRQEELKQMDFKAYVDSLQTDICIQKSNLERTLAEKHFPFGKRFREWRETIRIKTTNLAYAEYEILQYTDPEVYAEVEEAARSK